MTMTDQSPAQINDGSLQFVGAIVLAVVMIAVVGTALVFEHAFGFVPCALCLEQRTPYYLAIPVAAVAAVAAWMTWPGLVSRGLLAVVGLLMTYGLALAVYHSGVEWGFWIGPDDCGAAVDATITDANDLLGALDAVRAPACGEAAGRFLGLSFAGWNAVASLGLAAISYRLAFGPSE